MSSEKMCCVPGCSGSPDSHTVLHLFPDPTKHIDRFRTWVYNIGGDILKYNNEYIYKTRRVCHAHFESKYCCRNNRISRIAIPTLNCQAPCRTLAGVTVHRFPNPKKEPDRFKAWVETAKDRLKGLSDDLIHTRRRVCHKHFGLQYLNRFNRLNILAKPTLFLPAIQKSNDDDDVCENTDDPLTLPDNAGLDPNFPEKICQKCLDKALAAYFFTQQCERAERALRNCFDDVYTKLVNLDPIDKPKRRGRQKLKPNHNVIYAPHKYVIDYAEPVVHLINCGADSLTKEPEWNENECKICWQVFPDVDALLNHQKAHPRFMWYHCRLCGKSFPKLNHLKKHHTQVHMLQKAPKKADEKHFRCNECGNASVTYLEHLQHVEKHKFKTVMQHVIEKKTDQLCLVCLDKSMDLVDMDEMVCIHGGHPELMGDKTLHTLLSSTLPDMNYRHNFFGTRICGKCLNQAITSYIFINQFTFTRERLDSCVSLMLESLRMIKPEANVFVQISQDVIMLSHEEIDETLLLDDEDIIDEDQIKVEVLEDEYRMKSDSESDTEVKNENQIVKHNEIFESIEDFENPAKNVTKTYSNKRLVNGLQSQYPVDVCSEFLTFNKKKKIKKVRCKFTCPLCNKHFISEYFLKRHIVKHVNSKVQCTTCQSNFKSKFYLYEHTKMKHLLNINNFKPCNICGRCFTSVDKLRTHKKHHKTKPCELCNKIFATQYHYESHIQRHSDKLKLIKQKRVQTCSFCEKECSNDNELSLHVNKVHLQIKPFSCDMCDRQFYTENNLKNHKQVHSMPSKESCTFCNKLLKSRKQLVIHVRQHIGVKPFSCQICGQGFYSNFKARQHMKVYHGGRFCCRICKSTFVTKCELKRHVNKDHSIM